MENKHCRRSIRMERFSVVDKIIGMRLCWTRPGFYVNTSALANNNILWDMRIK